MFAITGATGKVGGAMAQALLARGEAVRVVVRDAAKGADWRERGADVVFADLADAAALEAAFRGTDGVFVLPPPIFDPEPGYPEARQVIDAVTTALTATRPGRVVCLSTVGADARQDNLLTQRSLIEHALAALDFPVTMLRPAWFIDNVAWDIPRAREEGVLYSFLQPADRAIPMVAACDVGAVAAGLILEQWQGYRAVGLEGPVPVSPNDIAAVLGRALGCGVRIEIVPRDSWENLFRGQGMRHPAPRMRMLDGFNEGWIGFGGLIPMRRGTTTLDEVIAGLLA